MLYGIKRIQYCQNNALAFNGVQNQFLGICPELTNTLTDVVGIAQRTATLTIEERIENRTRLFTAKLQFTTPHIVDFTAYSYAFVVTTTEGIRFLIGAQSRPRVVVTTVQSQTGAADGSTGYTTTATFTANYRPNQLPAPEEPAPDTRQFTVCCGQIVGETIITTNTVIWQDEDGTVLETKTYEDGESEPSPSSTPGPKTINELFGKKFKEWTVEAEGNRTKIYKAVYQLGVFDWSSVEPTGDKKAALNGTSTLVTSVNTPKATKAWVFYSFDGTTIDKSPFYFRSDQDWMFSHTVSGGWPCLCFIFCYQNQTDITESGLPSGYITSGENGQWYALGTQGNYKVYGWISREWQGQIPRNGVFIPMT